MKGLNKELHESIKALRYYYLNGRFQYRSAYSYWRIDWFDGRTSAVKRLKASGFTREDVASLLHKMVKRRDPRVVTINDVMTQAQRAAFLKMVNECTFDINAKSSRYNCTGIDYKAFHRPSSSGGWVLIAPDEPGNNWHTADPVIVKFLSRKFLK